MAIRALNSVIVANYDTLATASWQAGACLAINSSTGNVELATRAASITDTAAFASFVGSCRPSWFKLHRRFWCFSI
jgi:hypothetical protein